MRFRVATTADVFTIMRLFQKSEQHLQRTSIFTNYRKLEAVMKEEETLWLLTESEGIVVTAIGLQIDFRQQLARISRILIDRDQPMSKIILRESIRHCIHFLTELESPIDIIYSTTLVLTKEQQDLTNKEGFKILGVFPNALGQDKTDLNGLSACFLKNSLEGVRQEKIFMHPQILPFYKISARECDLPEVQEVSIDIIHDMMTASVLASVEGNEFPKLELIRGENFVKEKFRLLRDRHFQVSHFYPFYEPNCIITDPAQEIEIFVCIHEEAKFAAIIGEQLTTSVNPVELFRTAQKLLRDENITYVEVINDASDLVGNECIIQSGMSPCAYFPSFKKQGNKRRDYVIFGRSFEYLCRPSLNINPTYLEFFREFLRIETGKYFIDIEKIKKQSKNLGAE